jgi:hypothetical protein
MVAAPAPFSRVVTLLGKLSPSIAVRYMAALSPCSQRGH